MEPGICFILGVLSAIIIGIVIVGIVINKQERGKDKPVGTLKVASDGEGEYLFLELEVPIEEVLKKKTVILKVSQK